MYTKPSLGKVGLGWNTVRTLWRRQMCLGQLMTTYQAFSQSVEQGPQQKSSEDALEMGADKKM